MCVQVYICMCCVCMLCLRVCINVLACASGFFQGPVQVCHSTRCTFVHPAELRTVHTSLLVLPDNLTHACLLPA